MKNSPQVTVFSRAYALYKFIDWLKRTKVINTQNKTLFVKKVKK